MEQSDEAAAVMQLVTDGYRSSKSQMERVLAPFGLSVMQYGLLMRAVEHPDITGAELARQVRVSPQAVQAQLVQLEQRKLIRRKRDQRTRAQVRITPAGRDKLAKARPYVQRMQVRMLESFDIEQRHVLRDLLSSYVKILSDNQHS